MFRRWCVALALVMVCAACRPEPSASASWDWSKYRAPDWRTYRAGNATAALSPDNAPSTNPSHFSFHDLKTESDRSLVQRLLGGLGDRIAYVDRYKPRWRYFRDDNEPAEFIDLYTQPHALGSQYGLCGAERYSFSFDEAGHISAVSVSERFGIEGPLFQSPISDHDWKNYETAMCATVPASHAPSYFPAHDVFAAQDVAEMMIPVIDLAASSHPLPYRLTCRDADKKRCKENVRQYLGALRLEDIDEYSLANCPPTSGAKAICFTVKTGDGRLGPFPKWITVKGSNYMKRLKVDSVDIDEGFTMS